MTVSECRRVQGSSWVDEQCRRLYVATAAKRNDSALPTLFLPLVVSTSCTVSRPCFVSCSDFYTPSPAGVGDLLPSLCLLPPWKQNLRIDFAASSQKTSNAGVSWLAIPSTKRAAETKGCWAQPWTVLGSLQHSKKLLGGPCCPSPLPKVPGIFKGWNG